MEASGMRLGGAAGAGGGSNPMEASGKRLGGAPGAGGAGAGAIGPEGSGGHAAGPGAGAEAGVRAEAAALPRALAEEAAGGACCCACAGNDDDVKERGRPLLPGAAGAAGGGGGRGARGVALLGPRTDDGGAGRAAGASRPPTGSCWGGGRALELRPLRPPSMTVPGIPGHRSVAATAGPPPRPGHAPHADRCGGNAAEARGRCPQAATPCCCCCCCRPAPPSSAQSLTSTRAARRPRRRGP